MTVLKYYFERIVKLFLFYVILILSSSSYGQDKKIVLQFDTLEFIDKSEDFLSFDMWVTNQGSKNKGEKFVPIKYHLSTIPNYTNTVYLRSDSSQLRIPFDNMLGYVELLNLYNSDIDTIKIDKYRLYSNCNFDTIKTCTTYFKNDKLLMDQKKLNCKTAIVPLNCIRKPPKTVILTINSRKYRLKVNFKSEKNGLIVSGDETTELKPYPEKIRLHTKETHSVGINTLKVYLKE